MLRRETRRLHSSEHSSRDVDTQPSYSFIDVQERSAALISLFLREKFDSTTDLIDFDIDSLRVATDVALENITLWRAFSGEGLFRSKLRKDNHWKQIFDLSIVYLDFRFD